MPWHKYCGFAGGHIDSTKEAWLTHPEQIGEKWLLTFQGTTHANMVQIIRMSMGEMWIGKKEQKGTKNNVNKNKN